MRAPGATELVIILVIVLVLFGAKRLPGLASSVGNSIKEFRKATKDLEDEDQTDDPAPRPADSDRDSGN